MGRKRYAGDQKVRSLVQSGEEAVISARLLLHQ
jgi:hypothetical protein